MTPPPLPTRAIGACLRAPPETFRDNFLRLGSRRALARLLEVPGSYLIWHLYRFPAHRRYRTFQLLKRNGKQRTIFAPASKIRILQQKLSQVLYEVYVPNLVAHGFFRERNIRTNAEFHRNREWVLRLDLEDFFPAINFGRVRGMFMRRPYNLPAPVATVLAQLCCFEGSLPQGAPTSPIISNMICSRLDNELRRLAADHRCTVTRYADDITISSNTSTFPKSIASRDLTPNGFITSIGPGLVHVIDSNGFRVHPTKSRLLWRHQRQDVTGVVINEKANVPRRFRDQIRSMLHAWEDFGLDAAAAQHDRYDKKRRTGTQRPSYRRVLAGKLRT